MGSEDEISPLCISQEDDKEHDGKTWVKTKSIWGQFWDEKNKEGSILGKNIG